MSEIQVSANDAAWLAGFFDGEGTMNFSFKKNSGTKGAWCLRVRITNTHAPSIERIYKLTNLGHMNITKGRSNRHRIVYNWSVSAKSAEIFLNIIEPFVFTKKEQVVTGLSAHKLKKLAPRERSRPGRGGNQITTETHSKLHLFAQTIKDLNTHKRAA